MNLFKKMGFWSRTAVAALALTFLAGVTAAGTTVTAKPALAATNMLVHYIDVGQADSALIQLPNGQNMVIDAGNNADATLVVNYLKAKGVTKVDYVIGTHPDEDHIGGLDAVINNFTIGKVFMPARTSTTQTYNDVLTAVANKGLTVTTAKSGVSLFNTTANTKTLEAHFVAPVKTTYTTNNNWSGVVRLVYGTTTFLFSGDAETQAETDMVASGQTLSANILKVGHHGSNTSSTDAYLDKVKPQAAIISCGLNNSYGHPAQTTIDKLKARGIKIYRTDLQGGFVFTSTGSAWSADKSPWF
ncbi:ComEC/Rec2 family competence protein [Tumebacillus permanentifrigoris]|uniref:Beta-lactamase superfamily II metal-dependent hydrolase n=1 Tax=Tumebacillus permanentifrigoris TaxID=378543 RepID=A0A316D8R0_9BACL|nr:ComEC/Rec2 family competence protein [Tumebacillus permanentifrigoris]PWK10318.1 beta-lactamase superfamily II metal-dependent hydrolase [Tumebacillus permanentifrigoris]